jgi:hypothetical protein
MQYPARPPCMSSVPSAMQVAAVASAAMNIGARAHK